MCLEISGRWQCYIAVKSLVPGYQWSNLRRIKNFAYFLRISPELFRVSHRNDNSASSRSTRTYNVDMGLFPVYRPIHSTRESLPKTGRIENDEPTARDSAKRRLLMTPLPIKQLTCPFDRSNSCCVSQFLIFCDDFHEDSGYECRMCCVIKS